MIGPTSDTDLILLHRYRCGMWTSVPRGESPSTAALDRWKSHFLATTRTDTVTVDRLTALQKTINGLFFTKEDVGKGLTSYFLFSFPEHNAAEITTAVLWLRRQKDISGVISTVRIHILAKLP